MAQIMELFSAELADFVKAYEKEYWRVDFHGEKYPPPDRDGARGAAAFRAGRG